MKRRSSPPSRPRPLLRRRLRTPFPALKLRERLESLGGAGEGLPTFFVLPANGDCVRLSGPELHGDIGVRIAGDDSGPTGIDGRTNEVTFDFRAADKAVVQAIVAGLGPEIREEKVRRPRQEVQGHFVPGHQPNIGHFLAWAARMPSMADHVILESAIDAGFTCDFDCFEHVHAAMRALDFMRMVRMEGGIGSACDGDEIPPHLRHPTRQGLTGKAAMVVVHAGRKISLDATIDSKPDPAGKRLRIHYGWSSGLQRYVVGWVSDLAPKAQ